MDYAEHTRTYAGFLRVTKIVIVCLVVLLVGMKIFLIWGPAGPGRIGDLKPVHLLRRACLFRSASARWRKSLNRT